MVCASVCVHMSQIGDVAEGHIALFPCVNMHAEMCKHLIRIRCWFHPMSEHPGFHQSPPINHTTPINHTHSVLLALSVVAAPRNITAAAPSFSGDSVNVTIHWEPPSVRTRNANGTSVVDEYRLDIPGGAVIFLLGVSACP